MPNPLVINVDLCSWLALTGKGQLQNDSFVVPPGIMHRDISPSAGRDYVLFCQAVFDGVTMGMVTYQVIGANGSVLAGYATSMNMMMAERQLINDRGRALKATINNSMASSIVCNMMYTCVTAAVWEQDVLPMLSQFMIGGH